MRIQNVDENIPEFFYIFLGIDSVFSPIDDYNYKLNHRLTSSGFSNLLVLDDHAQDFLTGDIEYLPFVAASPTTNSISTFTQKLINNYAIEYELELCRKKYFKQFPSRLSGLYAFGDYESCKKASEKYKWDLNQVKKFKPIQIVKIAKLNMEIISLLRAFSIASFSLDMRHSICTQYWEGAAEVSIQVPTMETDENHVYKSGTIYEYLIEGILEEIQV